MQREEVVPYESDRIEAAFDFYISRGLSIEAALDKAERIPTGIRFPWIGGEFPGVMPMLGDDTFRFTGRGLTAPVLERLARGPQTDPEAILPAPALPAEETTPAAEQAAAEPPTARAEQAPPTPATPQQATTTPRPAPEAEQPTPPPASPPQPPATPQPTEETAEAAAPTAEAEQATPPPASPPQPPATPQPTEETAEAAAPTPEAEQATPPPASLPQSPATPQPIEEPTEAAAPTAEAEQATPPPASLPQSPATPQPTKEPTEAEAPTAEAEQATPPPPPSAPPPQSPFVFQPVEAVLPEPERVAARATLDVPADPELLKLFERLISLNSDFLDQQKALVENVKGLREERLASTSNRPPDIHYHGPVHLRENPYHAGLRDAYS